MYLSEYEEHVNCDDCETVVCNLVHVKFIDDPKKYSIHNDNDLQCITFDGDDDLYDNQKLLLFVERASDSGPESAYIAHHVPPDVPFDIFYTTITFHDNPRESESFMYNNVKVTAAFVDQLTQENLTVLNIRNPEAIDDDDDRVLHTSHPAEHIFLNDLYNLAVTEYHTQLASKRSTTVSIMSYNYSLTDHQADLLKSDVVNYITNDGNTVDEISICDNIPGSKVQPYTHGNPKILNTMFTFDFHFQVADSQSVLPSPDSQPVLPSSDPGSVTLLGLWLDGKRHFLYITTSESE